MHRRSELRKPGRNVGPAVSVAGTRDWSIRGDQRRNAFEKKTISSTTLSTTYFEKNRQQIEQEPR